MYHRKIITNVSNYKLDEKKIKNNPPPPPPPLLKVKLKLNVIPEEEYLSPITTETDNKNWLVLSVEDSLVILRVHSPTKSRGTVFCVRLLSLTRRTT